MKKELEKFGLTVTDIGSWVQENGQELLEKSILAGETISYIGVYPGVKYKEQLKFIDTNATFQAAACGTPTTSGSTTITDKDVEVKPFMVYETLCPSDLNQTSLQLSQTPGLDTTLPFEGQFVSLKSKRIAEQIEKNFWVKASGSTDVAGILNQVDADSDVVDVVFDFSNTGLTDAQLIAGYESLIDEVPEEIQGAEDLTLFLGKDAFRRLSRAFLNTANVLMQKFDFNGIDVFEFPGSENVRIRPVNGLNSANNTDKRVLITPASNLLYVCDLQDEESRMWYSEDDRIVKYMADFKYGPAYYFGSYIVVSQKS